MTRRAILQRMAVALAPLIAGCGRAWPRLPSYVRNGIETTDQYEIGIWQIEMRRTVARSLPETAYSDCKCCKLPWWIVEGHTVMYSDTMGCFAVCEMCFKALGPEGAFPYYVALVERDDPGDETKIERLRQELFGGGYFQPLPSHRSGT